MGIPKSEDAVVLQFCGILGHGYAVTRNLDGKRALHGETGFRDQAVTWARECDQGRAFKKAKRGYQEIKI